MKKLTDLWNLTAGFRKFYLAAVIFMALGSFAAFLIPLVGKITIDGILILNTQGLSAQSNQLILLFGGVHFLSQNLWIPATILVLLSVFSGSSLYLKDRFSLLACEAISKGLRDRLYNHLQHIDLLPFAKFESGDLVQRCTSDIETVRIFLSKQIVEIGRSLIMLLLVVPMMISLDLKMSGFALCLLPIIILFSFIFFQKIKRVFLKVDEAEGALTSTMQENLTGIRVVRAFTRQAFEIEKFTADNARYRDEHFRLIKILAIYWGLSDFLCIGQMGLTLFGGGWLVAQGQISIGTLYAFITYLGILLWPIRQMGRTLTDSGKAIVAMGRISEVLSVPQESGPPPSISFNPQSVKGEISFKHLGFRFKEQAAVVDDVSLEIKAGQTVAIVGPTGSGKSTLISLLLRLYDFQTGSIELDGKDIRTISRKQLRSVFGAVLQEPFIYTKTARENIRLADESKREPAVVRAAEDACIHQSIRGFQKGYDTEIGERGVTLSGGQKQRVTMARSFLKTVPILIWDDALSAVDATTERQILETLQSRYGKLTTLIITHHLLICQKADHILVMDKGRVVQQGNHQALVSQDGFYKAVWEIQSHLTQNTNEETP